MKKIILLFFIHILFSMDPKDLKYLKNFDAIKDIKERNFSVLWEIPVNNENRNNFTRYNYDSEKISLKNYKTSAENTILILYFEKGELHGSASISDNDYYYNINKSQGYWLGLVPVDISYNYLKSLLKESYKKEAVYPLLISHRKDIETMNYFIEKYDDARYKEKKKIIFWLGQIHNEKSVEFLMKKYNDEASNEIREKVIFSLYCNKTDLAKKELLKIAKLGKIRKMRKKAIFWLGQKAAKQVKHFFKDIIYNDEDIKIKEAAIFALYNMKDSKSLKEVASYAKDYRLRKKAMFWMSQMKDVDISFFEDILNKGE